MPFSGILMQNIQEDSTLFAFMLFQCVSILPNQNLLEVMNELIQQFCIICADQVKTADNAFQRSHSGYISRKLVVNPLSDNVMRSQAKILMGITYQGIYLRKPLCIPSFIHCCCAPFSVMLSGFSALVIRDN